MVWFLRESADMKVSILDLDHMTCAYPDKLNLRRIVNLTEEEICYAGRKLDPIGLVLKGFPLSQLFDL